MRTIGQAGQRFDGFRGEDGIVLSGNGKTSGGVIVRNGTMLRHGVADRPLGSFPVIASLLIALLAFGLAGASLSGLIIISLGLISVSLIGIVAMTRGPGQIT